MIQRLIHDGVNLDPLSAATTYRRTQMAIPSWAPERERLALPFDIT